MKLSQVLRDEIAIIEIGVSSSNEKMVDNGLVGLGQIADAIERIEQNEVERRATPTFLQGFAS